jgi:hypothetical protein
MEKFVYYEGVASLELMQAWSKNRILQLLKKYGLPCRKYAYGEVPIAFEFEIEKVGYSGLIRRKKATGRVRAHVNLGLVLLEKYCNGKYRIYKANSPVDNEGDPLYTDQELSERYAIQQLFEKVLPEEIEAVREEIKNKLSKIMTIEKELNRWVPFPQPKIVDFDEVFA